MRKYLYLITDHPNEKFIGNVEARDKPKPGAEKNREVTLDLRDVETGEDKGSKSVVGLGYHHFDDRTDYEERFADVAYQKLAEIGTEHLETAGIDPAEVGHDRQ